MAQVQIYKASKQIIYQSFNALLEQLCKGNPMIRHGAQILARGIQSILDKYNTVEGCIPCKGDPKRKL